jgi:hypothetical protein
VELSFDGLEDVEARFELTYGGTMIVASGYLDSGAPDPASDEEGFLHELEAAYRDAIAELRHALGLVLTPDRMEFAVTDSEFPEAAERAIESLSPGELAITVEDLTRIHDGENKTVRGVEEFLGRMERSVEAQERHPGEDIGLGEAVEWAKESKRRMRRIVGKEE